MKRITMVSTRDDGSCGIGAYTGTLRQSMDSVEINHMFVELRSLNPFHYASTAVSAALTDTDVIHIQHEYGIFGPKSVTSWIFFPLLFLLASLQGKPIVITMHSAWNSETISPPFTTAKKVYVYLNNKMLSLGADYLLFLSDNCKEGFSESVLPPSYRVLPHGVQTETMGMTEAEAKQQFGYDSSDPLIVEPGYVRPEKGQDVFVELAKQLPSYEFLIAGGVQADEDQAFFEEIQREAPKNLQITGVLDDDEFHAAFNAADLVVLPYREVTQSGIFNWCSAYGLPVAGSESEYFNNLKSTWGCIDVLGEVNSIDPEQIVELMENEEEKRHLISHMEEYQKARSMSAVAEEHYEVYEQVVKP